MTTTIPAPAGEDGWFVKPEWREDGPKLLVLYVGGERAGSVFNEDELGWSAEQERGGEIFPADGDGYYFPAIEAAKAALIDAVRPLPAPPVSALAKTTGGEG